jgi:hypothetical protein
MALHRDIFWVGRQWAVTGSGLQAVDQRRRGEFDIDVSRLWDDGLCDGLRAHPWFNVADFEKALEIARARFPRPPRNAVSTLAEPGPIELSKAVVQKNLKWRIERASARFVPQWRVRR